MSTQVHFEPWPRSTIVHVFRGAGALFVLILMLATTPGFALAAPIATWAAWIWVRERDQELADRTCVSRLLTDLDL